MTNATHKTNLGSFGEQLQSGINGYIPNATTGPWELTYDHGTEEAHDNDGSLTEYGEWWESDGFPEIKAEAAKAIAEAESAVQEWRASK